MITSRTIVPVLANSDSAVYQLGSDEVLRTTIEERPGVIRLQTTIVDTSTQTVRQAFEVSGRAAEGFLPLLNATAKEISGEARNFSTKNDNALASSRLPWRARI